MKHTLVIVIFLGVCCKPAFFIRFASEIKILVKCWVKPAIDHPLVVIVKVSCRPFIYYISIKIQTGFEF